MKTNLKFFFGMLVSLSLLSGCDNGFDEINTNKVDPTSLAPSLILNKAIINTDGFGTLGMLCYNFGIVQQIITPYGSSLSGAQAPCPVYVRSSDRLNTSAQLNAAHTTHRIK